MMRTAFTACAALALAACGGAREDAIEVAEGCGANTQGVTVTDAWVRAAGADRPATAVYLTLCNAGPDGDALIAAVSPAASAVELHETTRGEGGVMRMSAVERFDLPAQAPVVFAPGGAHIMLIGLTGALEAGGSTQVTLRFASGTELTVEAPVRTAEEAAGRHDHH